MKTRLFPLLALALLVLAASCQLTGEKDPVAPDPTPVIQEDILDLDSPTGGFTENDELPAFGQPELFESLADEPAYNDRIVEEQEVIEREKCPRTVKFRLRAVWGNLINTVSDTLMNECCQIDWTGGMHLEGGIIVVEKLIKFDARDYLTRIDRSTIEWVSHTCPHIDGIQVKLIVPPAPRDSTCAAGNADVRPPLLTFKAGPFSRTFTLDELEALRLHRPVDRCGNGIMIASHIIPHGCPHGYLLGEWKRTPADTLHHPETGALRGIRRGVFRGVWMSERGMASGYLRGIFGINSLGEQVFHGKYIDFKGRFMGLLSGHYGAYPAFAESPGMQQGWFQGTWFGRSHVPQGKLKGEWVTDNVGHGFFKGVWGKNCSKVM
ncbi:MAG: hypothetical protein JXB45_00925 [Candidatus Krumholzibacteriota bacterium]|nr:hypothetical protein [Candidatus Krumholzibacteriota bacterium]